MGQEAAVTKPLQPQLEWEGCGCSLTDSHSGASTWSGCSVRIGLWPRLPHGCHRPLSIMPVSGASTLINCRTVDAPVTPGGGVNLPPFKRKSDLKTETLKTETGN